MTMIKLKDDFLLGTATSSTQIEGGDTNNTWYQWCKEKHILENGKCIRGCDHWNHVAQDTALLKNLGVQTHRMSVEWSRLEPEPRVFAHDVLEHYRKEIKLLLTNDIKPLITLHHFSEPLWFHELGGWKKQENAELFLEYGRYVVENLGDLVSDWVTFNEPNVYGFLGYVFGIFPPGVIDINEAFKVMAEIIKTHVKLYDIIHKIRKERNFSGQTMVGAAKHLRVFVGVTPIGKLTACAIDYLFNEISMEGLTTGRLKFPLPRKGYKYQKGRYVDFLGINYYTRNIVEFVFDSTQYFHTMRNDERLAKNDLGWDIYPEGIYRVCKKYYNKYNLPIFITENGISDQDDSHRPAFIRNHLSYIVKAINEGVNIQRYYYWTLMDNFEWLEGEEGYFGLYHCDFDTQERTARQSAALYEQICKEKTVHI